MSACTGTVTDGDRPPGGVGDKTVVDTPRGPAVAEELVVTFTVDAGDEAVGAVLTDLGGTIVWRGPRTGAYLVSFGDADTATRALAALQARPEVSEATRNIIMHGTGLSSSPGAPLQWNLGAMSLNVSSGWGDGEGVRVAVLDTGVAYEDFDGYALAPDLAGVVFSDPLDVVNDDLHANDDHGHGTHISGVLASTGQLYAISAGVQIIPIKVLGADNRGTELGLAEGLLHAADAHADVVNMSLSFPPAFFPSRFLQGAVERASRSGAILVAAAGNHARNVVTYPAAFREVIGVGASELDHLFDPQSARPWQRADQELMRAGYSNRGYLLDVLAPGGSIDRDIDGDGNPEAILAQSFSGDPTDFEYVYYAGTSQAAAQVSGLAAIMRAEHPDLTARDIRMTLGETAEETPAEGISSEVGRGLVSAKAALAKAGSRLASRDRPRFSASVRLALVQATAGTRARAVVEVVDGDGAAAPDVEVYGSFSGGVTSSHHARTNANGRVTFNSATLADPRVVAFQVEAVVVDTSPRTVVERPGGFLRIDSCSLDLLAQFAEGSGLSSSPGSPISLTMPSLNADDVSSVLLVNFAWTGATAAMAVVADQTWFEATYPTAPDVRVVSLGGNLLGDPIRFDALASFPEPIEPRDTGECVDLVVQTFGSGLSSSPGAVPVLPDPDGSCTLSADCAIYRTVFEALWSQLAPDVGGVTPAWTEATGMDQATYDTMAAMMSGYVEFGQEPISSPVIEYADTLEAAGIGASPWQDKEATDRGAGAASWTP
ncbi:MAG TPA: S8 family serine peptidase [Kofleriaceae bacterium]|nr:S8 family serine peptidase [Kofleriaceae bacterium]